MPFRENCETYDFDYDRCVKCRCGRCTLWLACFHGRNACEYCTVVKPRLMTKCGWEKEAEEKAKEIRKPTVHQDEIPALHCPCTTCEDPCGYKPMVLAMVEEGGEITKCMKNALDYVLSPEGAHVEYDESQYA